MIRRLLTAAVLIPALLAVIFHAPRWLFVLVVCGFLLGAVWEFQRMARGYGLTAFEILYPLTLPLPWLWVYRPDWVLVWVLLAGLCLATRALLGSEPDREACLSASFGLLGFLYTGIPLSIACDFHFMGAGGAFWRSHPMERGTEMMLILVTIWVSDSGAYFGGKAFGKTKVVPRISPSKSLEGYLFGLVLGVPAACLFGTWFVPSWPLWLLLLLGFVVVLTGMLGDLFESLLKRGAGLKDSSRILPGHGGVLDRLDSLLFAFPSYFILLTLLE